MCSLRANSAFALASLAPLRQMWVDITPKLRSSSSNSAPLYDIAPPPPADFEVRIVVWKCEGIPAGDEFSDQSDMYVKLRLGEDEWRSTDVHYFAKKGKGSFNFRFKFPLKLRHGGKIVGGGEGAAYLKVQVGGHREGSGWRHFFIAHPPPHTHTHKPPPH